MMRRYALLACLVLAQSMPCSAQFSKGDLIAAAKANEDSITNYSATMAFDCYNYFVKSDTGQWSDFHAPPIHTYHIEHHILAIPARQLYRVTSQHTWNGGGGSYIEQLNEQELQVLALTDTGDPESALVDSPANTRYYQYSVDPFMFRSYVFVFTSRDPTGTISIPLSVALEQAYHFAILGPETISGEECLSIAALTPNPRDDLPILFWASLAVDRQLVMVKQQLMFFAPFRSDDWRQLFAASNNDFRALATTFQGRCPASLTVAEDLFLIGRAWVPSNIRQFAFRHLQPQVFDDITLGQVPQIQSAVGLAGFTDSLVIGYNTGTILDRSTVRINQKLAPDVFGSSIIPSGMPVHNLRLGVSPNLQQHTTSEMIQDLDLDLPSQISAPIGEVASVEQNVPDSEHARPEIASRSVASTSTGGSARGTRQGLVLFASVALAFIAVILLFLLRRYRGRI